MQLISSLFVFRLTSLFSELLFYFNRVIHQLLAEIFAKFSPKFFSLVISARRWLCAG